MIFRVRGRCAGDTLFRIFPDLFRLTAFPSPALLTVDSRDADRISVFLPDRRRFFFAYFNHVVELLFIPFRGKSVQRLLSPLIRT